MFGEMIGLWLVQAWADQGCPKNPRLVELGPGRGTLMADILRTAAVAPEFLADLDVVLVEASPALQQVQADKLRGRRGYFLAGAVRRQSGRPAAVPGRQ